MNNKQFWQAGMTPILIAVIALVALVVLVGGGILIKKTFLDLPTTSPAPKITPKIETPATGSAQPSIDDFLASQSGVPTASGAGALATTGKTKTGWAFTSDGGDVSIIPYFTASRKYVEIDFIAIDFANITNISYTLSYDSDSLSTQKGADGEFTPGLGELYSQTYGKNYYRKEISLGTCSGTVCTFDLNPRNFLLSVKVTTKNSAILTTTLTLTKIP